MKAPVLATSVVIGRFRPGLGLRVNIGDYCTCKKWRESPRESTAARQTDAMWHRLLQVVHANGKDLADIFLGSSRVRAHFACGLHNQKYLVT